MVLEVMPGLVSFSGSLACLDVCMASLAISRSPNSSYKIHMPFCWYLSHRETTGDVDLPSQLTSPSFWNVQEVLNVACALRCLSQIALVLLSLLYARWLFCPLLHKFLQGYCLPVRRHQILFAFKSPNLSADLSSSSWREY